MGEFNFCLKRITLENYRKYSNATFELQDDMNIFVGKNAAGKTTVLESVCVILGAYLAAFKKYVPSRFVFNIASKDVRIKYRETILPDMMLSNGEPQFPCRISSEVQFGSEGEIIEYKRTLEKMDGRTKFDGSNPMQKQVTEWEELNALGWDQDIVLPIILYLSSSRLWDEGKNGIKGGIPSRADGYARCLDRRRGMQLCLDYLSNLTLVAAQENNGKEYPAKILINQAINKAFEGELPEGERIEYSVRFNEFVQRRADGSWIPYSELSDGYRNVIRIISEIACRMCILNPYLKEETLQKTPGVVVIDEIDLSLHPTWQRRIIGILKELFPRVQFVCATHSPFIIQSLDDKELHSLDKEIEVEYSGRGIEDIAEKVMGVDMPNYSEERAEYYQLSMEYFEALKKADTEEELDEMRNRLEQLIAKYNDDPVSYALLKQEYLEQYAMWEKKNNETGK